MLVGYSRVSTATQQFSIEDQCSVLAATGCTKVFREMVSAVGVREQLAAALEFVREGDTLVVVRLDRLARSTSDLLTIVDRLDAKGVALRILDWAGGTVDTKSASGKLFLTMTAAFAAFERQLIAERARVGIEAAKLAGKYKGRAPTARRKSADVHRLKQEGLGAVEIASRTGMSRASVYRILSAVGS